MTALAPRVVLACDDGGGWTLSEQGAAAERFSDFEAALHCARRAPADQIRDDRGVGARAICLLPAARHLASLPRPG